MYFIRSCRPRCMRKTRNMIRWRWDVPIRTTARAVCVSITIRCNRSGWLGKEQGRINNVPNTVNVILDTHVQVSYNAGYWSFRSRKEHWNSRHCKPFCWRCHKILLDRHHLGPYCYLHGRDFCHRTDCLTWGNRQRIAFESYLAVCCEDTERLYWEMDRSIYKKCENRWKVNGLEKCWNGDCELVVTSVNCFVHTLLPLFSLRGQTGNDRRRAASTIIYFLFTIGRTSFLQTLCWHLTYHYRMHLRHLAYNTFDIPETSQYELCQCSHDLSQPLCRTSLGCRHIPGDVKWSFQM